MLELLKSSQLHVSGASVQFRGVRKTYDGGRTFAVDRLDLDVAEGEFLTLLGPSGSGKTTTLMMLAGFEDPSSGEVYIGDQPVTAMPSHRRGLGVVFQSYALFPHMTISENLAFPLVVRRLDKFDIAAKVEAALAMVELQAYGDRRPDQLSGGQQQRAALARALIFQPRLVLMDEPLGALDKQLRDQMQFEIKALQKRLGVTVVYVTHDQGEALSMSDRVAIFNKGLIEQLDAPDRIYRRPKTLFVASFMGDNNRLNGIVTSAGPGEQVTVSFPGGATLRANGTAAAGDVVTACVRPEAISLSAGGAGLAARVEHVMPMGDQTRMSVICPTLSSSPLIVKMPSRAGSPVPGPGEQVTLDIDQSDTVAFAAGNG